MRYTPKEFKWGFQADEAPAVRPQVSAPKNTKLQYMKLLLDPSQEKKGKGRVQLADPLGLAQMRLALPPGKLPVDVASDYLKCLKEHTLDVLSKSFGTNFWNSIPIEYHLTIPAVWSEAAKTLTIQAAERAGIGSKNELVLITEPEAAALYCLTDMYHDLLKIGETFVVADCGRGTVDLVSYKILERKPNLKVKEVAVGGGLCGSVFLNRRFEAFVRKRIGSEVVDEMIRKDRPYRKMMKDFDERLKHIFRDSSDQELLDCDLGNAVRDDVTKRVEDGFLEITRKEMSEVFNPVIQEILRLVREEIDTVALGSQDRVSTVLLVGEFGSSPYLQKQLSDHIAAMYQNRIKVLQPPNAWNAVVRGAVIHGLQRAQIQSRKAHRSYGVKCGRTWVHGNPPTYKKWCPFEVEHKCRNQVIWYVKKGDEISETTEFAIPFQCLFTLNSPLKTTNEILASDSPASSLEENADHDNVYTLCILDTDLSRIRDRFLRCKNSKGESYYDVQYELVMQFHSTQLSFSLRYNGVVYADMTTIASFAHA
ncbi:actin-like ATPase domain-containing protein [Terfezia boudieri ATCC MYA-4762]|uniref:Actin-like ATPase domain-containing protein n=1 Tax=Terfezia boudieri ATCC MYA-4762 TaxID=1051890 RepID=A0A3N4MD68_9PEZI|nr:actin-like ATPase domain-containing protein [Terfezia boudieri ATCC MYA-4762]